MPKAFEKIEFIVGSSDIIENMGGLSSLKVFDEKSVAFLNRLSALLLNDPSAKQFSDVITFAFWCRKANISALSRLYENENRLGRGIAFHIAPSNVPVNFAFTLAAGMLSGCMNIVRIPSKTFKQTEIICDAMAKAAKEFPSIAERFCIIKYGHDDETTDFLSGICMTRIIWGGDETVTRIRKSPLPPLANEIAFPDRFSVCLIDSENYLAIENKIQTARDFFNDTFLSDQNACTSPRIVLWLGQQKERAKELFWNFLSDYAKDKYQLQPVQTVNKLSTFYKFASHNDCKLIVGDDQKIIRVRIDKPNKEVWENLDNSGYFYECDISEIVEILPLCVRKCQTLSYIGIKPQKIIDCIMKHRPNGIDRIVPTGKTMDFNLIWDGIDIVRTMSRIIYLS